MINVKKKSEKEFTVTVEEAGGRSEHAVTLDDEYYQHLTQGKIEKEELVRKSFEFLLQRESKESILSKFDLRIISRYFPEFESEVKRS
ncbi:MAG: hypothetical protein ACLFPU_09335 [Dehalococcoidia bacterium]